MLTEQFLVFEQKIEISVHTLAKGVTILEVLLAAVAAPSRGWQIRIDLTLQCEYYHGHNQYCIRHFLVLN